MKEKNDKIRFFTTAEIAEMLRMNVQVIARKLQHGEIAGYKIGKDWRVKESDFWTWLEKHTNRGRLKPAEQIIDRFMKNGKFETLPVQKKKRQYILDFILKQFRMNRVYTEENVNEIIARYHDDYCRIRREFIDARMMYRKDGNYRRNSSYRFQK